jgi:guanylate kinase
MAKKGMLFIISAPSGSGKTSLCKRVVKNVKNLKHSISHTTRAPRPREKEGINYFFVSEEQFQKKIKKNEFVEWAKVHQNYYGTSVKMIRDYIDKGTDLILDLDVQGAEQLRKKFEKDAVFVFIIPPSLKTLHVRLKDRGSDSDREILRRMSEADKELSFYEKYDYILVNRDLEETAEQLQSIIISERCRTNRFSFPKNFYSR